MLHFFKLLKDYRRVIIYLIIFISFTLNPLQAMAFNTTSLGQWVTHPSLSDTQTAVQIISLKTGNVLYKKNEHTPLVPASNMKLLTSAAALTLLKPEFQFKTEVYSDAPATQTKPQKNIYLKGYGDPDLNDERLYGLAQDLKLQGLSDIPGNLIVDDFYFDRLSRGQGWKKTYGNAAYNARISALSLNRNTIKVWIKPTTPGQMAKVEVEPVNRFFKINNLVRTSHRRTKLKIVRTLDRGKNLVTVSGNIYFKAAPEIERINLDKPAIYTGAVFKNMLNKLGVRIRGQVRLGKVPSKATLLAVSKSPPLREIVADLNKHSINLIGENLLKTIGAVYSQAPGSAKKGAQAIQKHFLQAEIGLPAKNGLVIVDGSGLSPQNRVTASALAKILRYMYLRFDLGSDYVSSLAISGVDGTLKKRFRNPQLKRRIRAKTGYINGVSTLSGYLQTKNNDILVFSVLINHFKSYTVARNAQENLFSSLLDYKEK